MSKEASVVIALTLAYNGAPFAGFARQPGQLTVQGSLEEALGLLFRRPIETVCAGRTDSGVHARGQVVSFVLDGEEYRSRSDYKILRSLNALTHDEISVLSLEEKPADFSARFSAVMREYRYFICTDQPAPLFMSQFSWHLGKQLNLAAMREGARSLIGEHDFRSFCLAASAQGKTTNRYVKTIAIEPLEIWGEHFIVITVEGNAFLHSMVRTIVGTLVAVGLGKRPSAWVQEVLDARDRSAAGENAPAEGLVFWRVDYEGERVFDPATAQHDIQNQDAVKPPSKQRGRRGGHKNRAEFVIPRGEGAAIISGAALSPVNVRKGATKDATAQDVTGNMQSAASCYCSAPYRYDSTIAASQEIFNDTDQFGEVIWGSDSDLDEPQGYEQGNEHDYEQGCEENVNAQEEPMQQASAEETFEKTAPIATFGSYPFQIKSL